MSSLTALAATPVSGRKSRQWGSPGLLWIAPAVTPPSGRDPRPAFERGAGELCEINACYVTLMHAILFSTFQPCCRPVEARPELHEPRCPPQLRGSSVMYELELSGRVATENLGRQLLAWHSFTELARQLTSLISNSIVLDRIRLTPRLLRASPPSYIHRVNSTRASSV